MEINQYIRLIRKWLWLIVLLAFVAGGGELYHQYRAPAGL